MNSTVVVVGAGGMGREWIRTILASDRVDLVGVVDQDNDVARAAAGSLAPFGSSMQDMIERSSPDFILDATVPDSHHEVTATALALGIAVLGEKPMAATLAQAADLVHKSTDGALFAVSQSRRYNEGLRRLRAEGRRMGAVSLLAVDFFVNFRPGGFREQMAHPLLLDMAIHQFDAVRFVLDDDAAWVTCHEHNPSWSWFAGDAAATVVFGMSGGTVVTFTGSWCNIGADTSWDSSWRLSGSTGTVLWDGRGVPVRHVVDASEPTVGDHPKVANAGIAGALHEFVEALHGGPPPMGLASDNIKSLAMVHAAIESSSRGAACVRVDQMLTDALAAAEPREIS